MYNACVGRRAITKVVLLAAAVELAAMDDAWTAALAAPTAQPCLKDWLCGGAPPLQVGEATPPSCDGQIHRTVVVADQPGVGLSLAGGNGELTLVQECSDPAPPWIELDGLTAHTTHWAMLLPGLPFVQISQNELSPPLGYPDQKFDFVYAISVFTHPSAELQTAWLRELRRILKPGGRLLITTQGEGFRDRLTDSQRALFDAGKLVVRYEETSGMNLCGAYHSEADVRRECLQDNARGSYRTHIYCAKSRGRRTATANARGGEILAAAQSRLVAAITVLDDMNSNWSRRAHAALLARDEESDLEIGAVCDETWNMPQNG